MSTKLVYNDKPIDLYQTVKIEEDITVVNIPNFRDLGPWCEIKDISAWRRFDNNQYLPYGIKVLVKKNNMEVDLPSFLDHENAEAPPVSAAHQTDDSNSKSKIINDTEVSTNDEAATAKPGTINRLRGTVGFKPPPPAISLNAAVIPPSSNEKVSSNDDTKSDSSDDDNHPPIIKRTAKYTIDSDYFSDISVDSDMSSPMKIKKEFISPNLSPTNESDGYSPPSAHELMAAKARVGQISEQTFNNFVSNKDKAPPGSNKSAIEPVADAENHDISDKEY
ncbi:hypothetical protein AYI70_g12202 [Smittium culicis]|uniref:Uncharacterized protein n=1 Tax=Smittium culicis TaxID=133412 RepID=A0A1R1WYG9_9FUNG|nr:hypothetical protein AYI70_g12202 [Smittium culicis]